jgi:hypothetical protein
MASGSPLRLLERLAELVEPARHAGNRLLKLRRLLRRGLETALPFLSTDPQGGSNLAD